MEAIIKNTPSQSAGTDPALKTVILRGELGRRYGARHEFNIKTPGEAIRALCANFPGFEQYVVQSSDAGVGYKVLVAGQQLPDSDQLQEPLGRKKTITIVPVIGGAKDGIGGVLLGAALIGSSFFLPTAPLISGLSMSFSSIAFNLGLSMAIGGVTSMLAGAPKATAPSERPENKPSYYFNGPVNTVAQGQPVPVGYGRMIVGGAIISAGIDTDEIEA